MSVKLSASLFRLPCNQSSRDNVGDLLRGTGAQLSIWKNSTAILQGAIFVGDPTVATNLVTDLSNITAVVLAMRAGSATGALLFAEQVVLAAQLNPALSYADWLSGANQHFQFELTPDLTNVAAQKNVWLVIGVNTTDAGAFPIATSSNVAITDPGISNPGDVNAPTVYTGWSKAEADARYAPLGGVGVDAAVTSIGDGAAGSLDAVPTVSLAVPAYRTLDVGGLQDWKLVASTSASSLDSDGKPAVQQPLDFNASTNAKVWFRQR